MASEDPSGRESVRIFKPPTDPKYCIWLMYYPFLGFILWPLSFFGLLERFDASLWEYNKLPKPVELTKSKILLFPGFSDQVKSMNTHTGTNVIILKHVHFQDYKPIEKDAEMGGDETDLEVLRKQVCILFLH